MGALAQECALKVGSCPSRADSILRCDQGESSALSNTQTFFLTSFVTRQFSTTSRDVSTRKKKRPPILESVGGRLKTRRATYFFFEAFFVVFFLAAFFVVFFAFLVAIFFSSVDYGRTNSCRYLRLFIEFQRHSRIRKYPSQETRCTPETISPQLSRLTSNRVEDTAQFF